MSNKKVAGWATIFGLIRFEASLSYLGVLPRTGSVENFLLIPFVDPVTQNVTHDITVTFLQKVESGADL